MAERIAYLEAVVGADITTFRRAMQEVRNDILDIGGISQGLRDVGRDLTFALTVPLLGLGAAATKAASDFDASMRNVASISDVVAGDFDNISQRVLQAGIGLRDGAQGMADALYQVVSAGYGLNDIDAAITVATQSAYTAEAGLSDLESTTRALVSVLNAYSMGAERAEYVSNVLTQTVALGVGSMDNLINSMSQTLPMTVSIGASFDDLGGTLAYLTQRSFSFATASTSLNNLMTKLIDPTDRLKEVYEELGVASGSELISKFGGLQQALQEIYNIIGNNPEALREIFPDIRGLRAATALFEDFERYTEVMAEFDATLGDATSSAREQQMQSFAYRVDLMGSSLQGLAIAIGLQLLPMLAPFVDRITDLIRTMAAASPEAIQLAIRIAGVIAVIPPLIWLLGALLTPIGAVVAGITALAIAWGSNWGGIRDTIENIVEPLIPIMRVFASVVGSMVDDIVQKLNTSGSVGDFLNSLWAIINQYSPMISIALGAIRNTIENYLVDELFPAIDRFGRSFFNRIIFALKLFDLTNGTNTIYYAIRNLFNGGLGKAFSGVGAWFEEHFPRLTEGVQIFLNTFGEWVAGDGINLLGKILGYGFGRLGKLVFDAIAGIFSGAGQENPIARSFREGLETGFADAMRDVNVTDPIHKLGVALAGILGVALLVSIASGGVATAMVSGLGIVFGAVKLALVPLIAPLAVGLWGILKGALAITGTLILPVIGTVIGGVLIGAIAYGALIPESERARIANILWDSIAAIAGVPQASDQMQQNFANQWQSAIADALGRVLIAAGDQARGEALLALAEQSQGYVRDYADTISQAARDAVANTNWDTIFTSDIWDTLGGAPTPESSPFDNMIMGLLPDPTAVQTQMRSAVVQPMMDEMGNLEYTVLNSTSTVQGTLIESRAGFNTELTGISNSFVTMANGVTTALDTLILNLPMRFAPILTSIQEFATPAMALINGVAMAWAALQGAMAGGIPTPGATALPLAPVGARANGGLVQAGMPYMVGERGAELFVPTRTGTIIPNSRMGGGTSVQNNNIQIVTNDPDRLLEQLRQRGIDLRSGKRF